MNSLTDNFNTVLTQYQNTYQEYLQTFNPNAVQSPDVNKSAYYKDILKELNNQLLQMNDQMLVLSKNELKQYGENSQENHTNEQNLQKNYSILLSEREHIDKMVAEFETLNSAYNNGSLKVTSNYYSYILLFFVVLLLIFGYLWSFTIGKQLGGGTKYKYNLLHWLSLAYSESYKRVLLFIDAVWNLFSFFWI
jgi:NADH:ubiquinone oxidoreductase subunit 3 (subunit A)